MIVKAKKLVFHFIFTKQFNFAADKIILKSDQNDNT